MIQNNDSTKPKIAASIVYYSISTMIGAKSNIQSDPLLIPKKFRYNNNEKVEV